LLLCISGRGSTTTATTATATNNVQEQDPTHSRILQPQTKPQIRAHTAAKSAELLRLRLRQQPVEQLLKHSASQANSRRPQGHQAAQGQQAEYPPQCVRAQAGADEECQERGQGDHKEGEWTGHERQLAQFEHQLG